MKIVIMSIFRDAEHYISRYFWQIDKLKEALEGENVSIRLILGYGDSTDTTDDLLKDQFLRKDLSISLVDVAHGGPNHGSVVHPQRFKQFAFIWNKMWDQIPQDADVVIFMESDLSWKAAAIIALIQDLEFVPAVAPLIILSRDGYPKDYFYDTWAFRSNEDIFTTHPPYIPITSVQRDPDENGRYHLKKIGSAGSLLVMRAKYARETKWNEKDLIIGICHQIYELGGSVWLDPNQKVIHS